MRPALNIRTISARRFAGTLAVHRGNTGPVFSVPVTPQKNSHNRKSSPAGAGLMVDNVLEMLGKLYMTDRK